MEETTDNNTEKPATTNANNEAAADVIEIEEDTDEEPVVEEKTSSAAEAEGFIDKNASKFNLTGFLVADKIEEEVSEQQPPAEAEVSEEISEKEVLEQPQPAEEPQETVSDIPKEPEADVIDISTHPEEEEKEVSTKEAANTTKEEDPLVIPSIASDQPIPVVEEDRTESKMPEATETVDLDDDEQMEMDEKSESSEAQTPTICNNDEESSNSVELIKDDTMDGKEEAAGSKGENKPKKMAASLIKLLQEGTIKNFNPELSLREKKKLKSKFGPKSVYPNKTRLGKLYDAKGQLVGNSVDLCDCLQSECPGCFFPCHNCQSLKCGLKCRVNRKWAYTRVTYDGQTDTTINPFLKNDKICLEL